MVRPIGVSAAVVLGVLLSATLALSDELIQIEKGMYGPYGKQVFLVANSEEDWNHLMSHLADSGGLVVVPAPAAPEVDWDHDCVVLLAAGPTGYDVSLTLVPDGNGNVTLDPVYVPLTGHDGGESLPYYLGRTEKHAWLKTQLWEEASVGTALPLSGPDTASPAGGVTWGALRAAYRR